MMTKSEGPPAVSASAISTGGLPRLSRSAQAVRVLVLTIAAFVVVREAFYWVDTFRTGCSATPVVVRLSFMTRAALYLVVVAGLAAAWRQAQAWTPSRGVWAALGVGVAVIAAGYNFAAYVPWDMCKSAGLVEHGPFGLQRTVVADQFIGPKSEGPVSACCTLICFADQTRALECDEALPNERRKTP